MEGIESNKNDNDTINGTITGGTTNEVNSTATTTIDDISNSNNDLSENLKEAIHHLQSVVESSCPDPYLLQCTMHNSSCNDGNHDENVRILPTSLKVPQCTVSSSSSSHRRSFVIITNHEITQIFDSIQTIIITLLYSSHPQPPGRYQSIQELIRTVVTLLINTIGKDDGRLFEFIWKDVMSSFTNCRFSSNSNNSNSNDHKPNQEHYYKLMALIIQILPSILHVPTSNYTSSRLGSSNTNTNKMKGKPSSVSSLFILYEHDFLCCIYQCVFQTKLEPNEASRFGNTSNYTRGSDNSDDDSDDNSDDDNQQRAKKRKKKNHKLKKDMMNCNMESFQKNKEKSSYITSINCWGDDDKDGTSMMLFDSIQSMLKLLQQYRFQNKSLVIQIICDTILPSLVKQYEMFAKDNIQGSHDDNHDNTLMGKWKEVFKLVGFVLFDYMSCKNNSRTTQFLPVMKRIRNLFQEKYDFLHIVEKEMSNVFIPYLISSHEIAERYLSILQEVNPASTTTTTTATTRKGTDSTTDTVYENGQDIRIHGGKWLHMDLYALLILYHYHPSLRKEMKQIIDDLNRMNLFPYSSINRLILDTRSHNSEERNIEMNPVLINALKEVGLYLLLLPLRESDQAKVAHHTVFTNVFEYCNNQRPESDDAGMVNQRRPYRRKTLNQTQILIQGLYDVSSTSMKQELIQSLLLFSSHSTFIPLLKKTSYTKPKVDKRNMRPFHRRRSRRHHRHQHHMEYLCPLPCNLNEFLPPKSISKSKPNLQSIYEITFVSLHILKSIVIDSPGVHKVMITLRQTVLDRIINFIAETAWCNHNHDISDITIKDECTMKDLESLDLYCSILVALSDQGISNAQRLQNHNEMMAIFNHLLSGSIFSLKSFTLSKVPLLLKSCQPRQWSLVTGIIFGKNLIASETCTSNDRSTIFHQVTKATIPSSSKIEQSCCLDPLVGYYSLCFFCSLCPDLTEKSNRKTKDISVQMIFKQIKVLMSHTQIVQLESNMSTNQKHGKSCGVALSYQEVPLCFKVPSKNKRKLAFCVASFCERFGDLKVESKILCWMRFMYALFDSYLAIGRYLNPHWIPDSWLTASLETIKCTNGSVNKVEYLSHVLDKNSPQKDYSHVMTSSDQITSMLFSMATLRAVLMNGHVHFQAKKMYTNTIPVKLIQFTIAKIFDLYEKCEQTLNNCDEKEIADLNVKGFITSTTFLMDDILSFPQEILCICLRGQLNEWGYFSKSKFGSANGNQNNLSLYDMHAALRESLISEVWMKNFILEYMIFTRRTLIGTEETNDTNPELNEYTCTERMGLIDIETGTAILQIALDLLLLLKDDDDADEMRTKDDRLYNHALTENSVSFVSFALELLMNESSRRDLRNLSSWLNLPNEQDKTISTWNAMVQITSFQRNKSISIKLLDFVSLVSKRSNSTLDNLSKIYWDQFCAMAFDEDMEDIAKIPFSFAYVTRQHLKRMNITPQSGRTSSENIYLSLFKSIMSLPLDNMKDVAIQHFILAHWAECALNGQNICPDYEILIDCLRFLLKQLAADVMMNTNNNTEQVQLTQPDGAEIKCLCIRTIPLVYEILLLLLTWTFCLELLCCRSERIQENVQNPEFVSSMKYSGALMSSILSLTELFTVNFALFPERSLGVTMKSSNTLLKVFQNNIDDYMRKEIETPQPTKKRNQDAFVVLKPVLDSFNRFTNTLKKFLISIPELTAKEESLHEKSAINYKAVSSLDARCECILSSIQDFNEVYKHNLPSVVPHKSAEIGSIYNTVHMRDPPAEKCQSNVEQIDNEDEDDEDSDSFAVVGDWGSEEE